MATTVPSIKVEGEANVKMENASSPSNMSDAYMDDVDDDPELSYEDASRVLWTSKVPKYLWDALSKAGDDDEIEIGTVRVEGSFDNPDRVSLMLNKTTPALNAVEKEYLLKKPTGQTMKRKRGELLMFSEKNTPGYKAKPSMWDMVDEDGNPGQGTSRLWEDTLREERKKENKGKFVPYVRKPIPKITALAGTVHQEYDIVPVQNEEYRKLDTARSRAMLRQKESDGIEIKDQINPMANARSILTASERAEIRSAGQRRKQNAKDDRNARLDKPVLLEEMFKLFREHRYWGLRDMRTKLRQPEAYVKENLEDIAIMHRHGDFNGRWELKDNFKNDDELMNAVGEAPKAENSDTDMDLRSDGDVDFEDV